MDKISREERSRIMRAIRSKDMKPEMAVRSLVHAMGFRYRLHRHDLPGRPDMVFPGCHKIIFVHGCFWHQHDVSKCKLTHAPRSNLAYWQPKLERNRARDINNRAALEAAGWSVFVVWECEIADAAKLKKRLARFLNARRRALR